jgi:hypothetical protein
MARGHAPAPAPAGRAQEIGGPPGRGPCPGRCGRRVPRPPLPRKRTCLARPPAGPAGPRPLLLAPLDPMIYDRRVTRGLWGFDYAWEAYVPAPKRKRGYYALPVLSGTELVGHVDLKADRERGRLGVVSRSVRRGHRTARRSVSLPGSSAWGALNRIRRPLAATCPRPAGSNHPAGSLSRENSGHSSASCLRRRSRARAIRLFTVPTLIPSSAAISS